MLTYRKAKTDKDFSYIASLFNPKNNRYMWNKKYTPWQVKQTVGKNRIHYIVVSEGKPVGWFNLRWPPNRCEILLGMIIDKPYQGKGYGKKTLEFVSQETKKLGIKKLRLEVFLENKRAINLYKKAGFLPTQKLMAMEKKL
ncbi:MAG: GNAT family N-acetyltransferase [Candidatus Buchananbacteria bacterium]